jgi:hypothetical protein
MQKSYASHSDKQLDDNGCSEPPWAAEFLGRKKDILSENPKKFKLFRHNINTQLWFF